MDLIWHIQVLESFPNDQECCIFDTGIHLADSDASNGGAGEDGGGGEEEEEDGEDAVAQPQVQEKEAAGLPRLLVGRSAKMTIVDDHGWVDHQKVVWLAAD